MISKILLAVAAIIEGVTGITLIITPALFVRLLFAAELSAAGLALGRVAGFGLLSLGIACWPSPAPTRAALRGLLIYNLVAAAYLAYMWFGGELIGRLLLPAIAIHAMLTLLLTRAWFKYQSAEARKP